MNDDLIERMARAHWRERQNQSAWPPIPWELTTEAERKRQIAEMRAAWAVAAEPTFDMQSAGHKQRGQVPFESVRDIWQAMHGAADG